MKRTLRLHKDVLTELSERELEAVAGADVATIPHCIVIRTTPLYTCLFVCHTGA